MPRRHRSGGGSCFGQLNERYTVGSLLPVGGARGANRIGRIQILGVGSGPPSRPQPAARECLVAELPSRRHRLRQFFGGEAQENSERGCVLR